MQKSVTVPELCGVVEQTIDALFADEVWVRGAISGLSRSNNGHVYFDLIDVEELGRTPSAVLPVALFANNKFRVNAILKKSNNAIRMEDGIEIQIRGRISYYPKQARLQLIMSLIDPAFTLGQIEASRVRILAALQAEGLLDTNRRVPMPALPLRIGLITSVGSAAEADFIHEIELSGLPFEITLIDARVQGDEAVGSLRRAFAAVEELDLDVIALVRGGGARTDLMAFDDEAVARCIANCSLPVITGIGHEVDRAIADEVAHRSAKTPTACAGVLIEVVNGFAQRVESAADRIRRRTENIVAVADQVLLGARSRIGRLATSAVEGQALRIEVLDDRSGRAAARCLERERERLDRAEIHVRALDPVNTMARGWSITRTAGGQVVRSVGDVSEGSELVTTLVDGEVRSTVDADD